MLITERPAVSRVRAFLSLQMSDQPTKAQARKDFLHETLDFCDRINNPAGGFYKYTPKERRYVRYYLTEAAFNQSKAAELAGYHPQQVSGYRTIACQLMKKPHILAAINRAFEALAMPKYEVIYRLGDIARGSLADVMNDDNELDLDLARRRGTFHLLKKVKIKRTKKIVEQVEEGESTELMNNRQRGPTIEKSRDTIETSIVFEEIYFEIHDPLKAFEMLGKHGKLFTDKIDLAGAEGQPLIGEGAQVSIYLPDNGRDDTSPAVMAGHGKRSISKTTRKQGGDQKTP